MESEITHRTLVPATLAADFAAKLKALGADSRTEEHRLQGSIGELVTYAKKVGEPAGTIQLANSVLEISATEWHALVTEYPEKSFRADLNRALRRAVGVRAGMQEEAALYGARTVEGLRKKRAQSFLYLAQAACQMLPELEALEKLARSRGLVTKADDLKAAIARMAAHCELAAEIRVETLT